MIILIEIFYTKVCKNGIKEYFLVVKNQSISTSLTQRPLSAVLNFAESSAKKTVLTLDGYLEFLCCEQVKAFSRDAEPLQRCFFRNV